VWNWSQSRADTNSRSRSARSFNVTSATVPGQRGPGIGQRSAGHGRCVRPAG